VTVPLGQGVTGLTLDLLAERIDAERMAREASEVAVEKARAIQFNEYERRLEALNGEAGRIREVLAQTVPREVFEAYQAAQETTLKVASDVANERRERQDHEVRALSDRLNQWQGSLNVWRFLAGGGGILGLVSIALWIIHPSG